MDLNIAKWLIQASLQSITSMVNSAAHYSILPKPVFEFHDQWIVDGGATSHFTGHKADFITLQSIPPKLVKGMNLNAVGIGQIKISTKAIIKSNNATRNCIITLHNMLYVPDLLTRGESVTRLLSQRAAHRLQGNSNPIFIDAANYSVIDMGEFYIPLDQLAHPNLLTLHSQIIKTSETTEMAL